MPKPKLTEEEKKERKRLLERKRKAKINSDPVLREEHLRKDRERLARRKAAGLIPTRSQMTENARRIAQEKDRISARAYYQRKKAKANVVQNNQTSVSVTNDVTESLPKNRDNKPGICQEPIKLKVRCINPNLSIDAIAASSSHYLRTSSPDLSQDWSIASPSRTSSINYYSINSEESTLRPNSPDIKSSFATNKFGQDIKMKFRKYRKFKSRQICDLKKQLAKANNEILMYKKRYMRLHQEFEKLKQSYLELRHILMNQNNTDQQNSELLRYKMDTIMDDDEIDQILVDTVKKYPEIYQKGDRSPMSIWKTIAEESGMDDKYCMMKWLKIQYNYAKIKMLLEEYPALESIFLVDPNTKRYLDGTLRFLDPFVKNIPACRIPISIHRRYDWVSNSYINKTCENTNSTSVTQEMVHALLTERLKNNHLEDVNMKFLMEVVLNTVNQCIMQLKDTKNDQDTEDTLLCSDLVKEENNSDDDHNEFMEDKVDADNDGISKCSENVLTTNNSGNCLTEGNYDTNIIKNEDDVMTESLDKSGIDDYSGNVSDNVSDDKMSIIYDEIKLDEIDIEENKLPNLLDGSVGNDDTENTSKNLFENNEACGVVDVKVEPDLTESESQNTNDNDDIKTYFNKLAEVASTRLSLEKQKELQKRVNLLMKELLEEGC